MLASESARNLKADLELIHRNAVALLDEVNQLLDFRKLDKQKAQLSLSYGNLSDFVKETCDSFKELSLKKYEQRSLLIRIKEPISRIVSPIL